jgi:hypothetical protein
LDLTSFFIVLLFICAYKAWVISPPCPHPLPYHPDLTSLKQVIYMIFSSVPVVQQAQFCALSNDSDSPLRWELYHPAVPGPCSMTLREPFLGASRDVGVVGSSRQMHRLPCSRAAGQWERLGGCGLNQLLTHKEY